MKACQNLILCALTLMLIVPSAGAAARKARPARFVPPDPNAVPWKLFPAPDTAGLFSKGRAPTTLDTVAEVLLDEEGVSFEPDGVVARISHKVLLPKSRQGAALLQTLPGAINGRGNSTTTFVVRKDGSKETATANRDGLVYYQAMYPGDVVYLCTREVFVPGRAGARASFSSVSLPRGRFPLRTGHIWVHYPSDRPVGIQRLNMAVPESSVANGIVSLSWNFSGLQPMPREASTAFPLQDAPALFVDSRPDLNWMEGLVPAWLRAPSGPLMKSLVRQIKAKGPDHDTWILAARQYVAWKVLPMRDEAGDEDSLRALTPESVLKRGSAGLFGKCVLLSGILRELGLHPGLAFMDAERRWTRLPVISPTAAAAVVVYPAENPVAWINPFSMGAPPERPEIFIQGLNSSVFGPDGRRRDIRVPIGPPEGRGMTALFQGTIDSSGVITGKLGITMVGEESDLWRSRLQLATAEQAAELAQRFSAQLLFTAETQEVTGRGLENPGDSASLNTDFRARDLTDRTAIGRTLRLPSRLLTDMGDTQRLTPRDLLRDLGSHVVRFELVLPKSWQPVSVRDTTSGRSPQLSWTERREIVGPRLIVTRVAQLFTPEVSPGEHQELVAEQRRMQLSFDRPIEFRLAP